MLNILSKIYWCLGIVLLLSACDGLDGDNSDFDFEGKTEGEGIERAEGIIRLATYNVHRCAPSGLTESNYDLTAQAISIIDADVVALQELDKNTTLHPVDQIQELAKRNGMKAYFCKAIDYRGGDYGVGIMSRNEPLSTYSAPLPGVEPRVFFVCEFEKYIFIATHLCVSSADNRSWSYDIIGQYLKENYSDSAKPVFLAGDLNAKSLPANCLENWKTLSAPLPTFWSTSSCLDYILLWKGNSGSCEVLRSMVPRKEGFSFYDVSDHLPIVVDINEL